MGPKNIINFDPPDFVKFRLANQGDISCNWLEEGRPQNNTLFLRFLLAIAISSILHCALFYFLPFSKEFLKIDKVKISAGRNSVFSVMLTKPRASSSKRHLENMHSLKKQNLEAEPAATAANSSSVTNPPAVDTPAKQQPKDDDSYPTYLDIKNYLNNNISQIEEAIGKHKPATKPMNGGVVFDPSLREKIQKLNAREHISAQPNKGFTYTDNFGAMVFVKGDMCFKVTADTINPTIKNWSLPTRCSWIKSESEKMMDNVNLRMKQRGLGGN